MNKKSIIPLSILLALLALLILIFPTLLTPPAVKGVMQEIHSLGSPEGVVLEDVTYKTVFPFHKHQLDIYYPLKPAAEIYGSYDSELSPVLVFIHGGSWLHGDKSMIRILDPFLHRLRESGMAVVAVNYTAGVTGGLEKPVENCRDAIYWLRDHGAEYGLNLHALGLYGASAGAHLALMSVPVVQEDPDMELRFILEEFGPVDLKAMADGDAFESSGIFRIFSDSVLGEYSPLHLVDESWPPLLMFHGTADKTVSIHQTELLAGKLEEMGVSYQFKIVPEGDHGFFNKPRSYWRELEEQCLTFLLPLVFPDENF